MSEPPLAQQVRRPVSDGTVSSSTSAIHRWSGERGGGGVITKLLSELKTAWQAASVARTQPATVGRITDRTVRSANDRRRRSFSVTVWGAASGQLYYCYRKRNWREASSSVRMRDLVVQHLYFLSNCISTVGPTAAQQHTSSCTVRPRCQKHSG